LNRFEQTLRDNQLALVRLAPEILQINVGKKCNQTCVHCHVNAGPARREVMTRETMQRILDWLEPTLIQTVDITGGAPELNPHFRELVRRLKAQKRHVIDRCNLTILFEPGQEDLGEFLAAHEVEIVASLPCYSLENVDAQRGEGVFESSIRALQKLNALGYGRDPNLPLNLVYNPGGAFLPGPQRDLEAAYKAELRQGFGVEFNHLYTITNMPIARFATFLRGAGQWEEYNQLLLDNFNPAAIDGLMCRRTLNIGWQGEVYDCDFNQMLKLAWRDDAPLKLWDVDWRTVEQRSIATGMHCFGCTAGAGSSCGGSLVEPLAVG
jgi:radical SAM/Cys-rich protein